jgi:SPP1 gp7 family putative phage head morphogenesis protein
MSTNITAIHDLVSLLGARAASDAVHLAKAQDKVEAKWRRRMELEIKRVTEELLDNASKTGRMNFSEVDFRSIVMEQSFDVQQIAIRSTKVRPTVRAERLAGPPKTAIPKSLRALREQWDLWRRKGKMPPRQRQIAEKLKKAYIEKVQSVWRKYSEEFRSGQTASQTEAVRNIYEGASVAYSRAKMIVETETTYYYNKARRDIFDESPDVTHYMFVALRDQATTDWCKTRQGLIYKKGDPLLDKETPPCFTGDTPVLTLDGWKRIDRIGNADYVWTHAKRWRRVTEIHRSAAQSRSLFQIGYALATSNHPYFERGRGFVEAEQFRTEEGVWLGSLSLFALLLSTLDAVVQKKPKILLKSLSRYFLGSYSDRRAASIVEGRQKEAKGWVLGGVDTRASEVEQTGLRPGESASDVKFRTHKTSPKIRWDNTSEVVYNIDVEEDQTYYAGGFLVHNCHWNCRSEILPLTIHNPSHLKLIRDASRQRRNNRCEPLPAGWTGRSA